MAVIATFVVALVLAGLTLGLRKLHRFKYRPTVLSVSELASLEQGGWKLQQRDAADGTALVGLVRPPVGDEEGPWVLFLPGNGANLLAAHQGALDTILGEKRIGISMWAYRGFEASRGVPSPELATADALGAIVYLKSEYGVDPSQVHLVGYSLGTPVASQVSVALSRVGSPPAGLALIAYADQIPVMQSGVLGSWKSSHVYDCLEVAASIEGPVVLLHGTQDAQLPLAGGEGVRNAIGGKAIQVVVEGANHTSILSSPETVEALATLLEG